MNKINIGEITNSADKLERISNNMESILNECSILLNRVQDAYVGSTAEQLKNDFDNLKRNFPNFVTFLKESSKTLKNTTDFYQEFDKSFDFDEQDIGERY